MIEQLGPAVDAQVDYMRERARQSYRPHVDQRDTRWHWLGRHRGAGRRGATA